MTSVHTHSNWHIPATAISTILCHVSCLVSLPASGWSTTCRVMYHVSCQRHCLSASNTAVHCTCLRCLDDMTWYIQSRIESLNIIGEDWLGMNWKIGFNDIEWVNTVYFLPWLISWGLSFIDSLVNWTETWGNWQWTWCLFPVYISSCQDLYLSFPGALRHTSKWHCFSIFQNHYIIIHTVNKSTDWISFSMIHWYAGVRLLYVFQVTVCPWAGEADVGCQQHDVCYRPPPRQISHC